ncbi:calumenin [Salix suchowensis]|nr:calumenin [Salix suchowensis]
MGFAVKRSRRTLTKEQIKKFFMRHDINKDNHLSRKEMKQAFEELGGAFSPYYRAAPGLNLADANDDGQNMS